MASFTFVFDDETARALRATATRLRKSRASSFAKPWRSMRRVRGRLTASERRRMLTTIDALRHQPVSRTGEAVMGAEIRAVRKARRQGGRKHPVE